MERAYEVPLYRTYAGENDDGGEQHIGVRRSRSPEEKKRWWFREGQEHRGDATHLTAKKTRERRRKCGMRVLG
ncbi:hypothetical protein KSP39_PZI024160 [Platanthera zijinensis]|uniref:Uncharacterized protein n=1 Tax=Platanthera zijinensis TaxID=2320716 RepID=A0AAP0FTP3_9ASPA